MQSSTVLGITDYVVIGFMLAVSACVGLYFRFTGGRQKTTNEFLMGGRNMGIAPVAFSLMATYMSAISVLGIPAETYLYGTQYCMWMLPMPIAAVLAAYGSLPVFYDLQVSTAYEYLEKRYGKTTRTVASGLFTLQMIFYMAVVLYAPSLALNAVTGLSTWASVISLAVVCTFYCSLGGLKAVLWTDVFQSLLMYVTTGAVFIKAAIEFGSLGELLHVANEGGRLVFFNMSSSITERYTFLNSFISGSIFVFSMYSTNQAQIQRLLSIGDLKRAQKAVLWSLPLIFLFTGLCFCDGVAIYSTYFNCDPLLKPGKKLDSADQTLNVLHDGSREIAVSVFKNTNGWLCIQIEWDFVLSLFLYVPFAIQTTWTVDSNHLMSSSALALMPYAIINMFGHVPGLSGLCIAGVFSASLSSVSSAVNSLTAVTMEDFIRPFCFCKRLTESWAAFLAKIIAIGYGALCLLLTFIVANFRGVLEASNVMFGMVAGPIMGIYILGMFTMTANEPGILIGLIVGFSLNAWMGFGSYVNQVKIGTLSRSTAGCTAITNSTSYFITNLNETTLVEDSQLEIVTETVSLTGGEEKYIFPLYRVSFLWYSAFGAAGVILVGYITSLLIGMWKKYPKPDANCLSPFVRKWYLGNHQASSMDKIYPVMEMKPKLNSEVNPANNCYTITGASET